VFQIAGTAVGYVFQHGKAPLAQYSRFGEPQPLIRNPLPQDPKVFAAIVGRFSDSFFEFSEKFENAQGSFIGWNGASWCK